MIAKYLLWIPSILALMLIPISSKCEEAAKDDVQSIYTMCKSVQKHISNALEGEHVGYCIGFISGTARQMFWSGAHLKEAKDREDIILIAFSSACPKTYVSNGAMIQAFINWAEKHPEKWSDDSHFGVVEAIRTTWPCLPEALNGR